MQRFEYRVIPAPKKGQKAKGKRTGDLRFANAMELLLNKMAEDGWEYDRADFLPHEERAGLTGATKTWRNLLVFRRAVEEPEDSIAEEPPVEDPEEPQASPEELGTVIPLTAREGGEKSG
ncbi:MAG: DUF4177 domain-containing protein [Rhodobacteraceae bacterium]|nr:DUF4177 domain-containing protein [Paracoccaceae bacterium]